MSRLDFLTKYAVDGVHYDSGTEIDKALGDEYWRVRASAINRPDVTIQHIDKALNMTGNTWVNVRLAAIQHPKATNEHILKALNDEHGYISSTAEQIKKERNL
jgi:hypothetical protein